MHRVDAFALAQLADGRRRSTASMSGVGVAPRRAEPLGEHRPVVVLPAPIRPVTDRRVRWDADPPQGSRLHSGHEPARHDGPTHRPIVPPATIGILGGGQLGRMLGLAARAMGYRVAVLDPDPDCPAAAVADQVVVGAYDDVEAALRLAEASDVVTYELEHVAAAVVEAVEARRAGPARPRAAARDPGSPRRAAVRRARRRSRSPRGARSGP